MYSKQTVYTYMHHILHVLDTTYFFRTVCNHVILTIERIVIVFRCCDIWKDVIPVFPGKVLTENDKVMLLRTVVYQHTV